MARSKRVIILNHGVQAILVAAVVLVNSSNSFSQQVIYHPNPASLASGMNPLAIKYQDYDTDGNGVGDYRIVGDVNRNGKLEWDDIQIALDGLCDPNGDGRQDAKDGKLKDLDGDGFADDSYCGTLHILPGTWVSRQVLDSNVNNKKDDQILLGSYQGLWFRGSGIDKTILKAIYSRLAFCRAHHETGCGGVCSRESAGYLTISDFSFEGLDGRTWGKMDCDGDGFDAGNAIETDYRVRTLQTAVTVFSNAPKVTREVKGYNIKVTKADYNGFALGEINSLFLSNLSVHDAGGSGILLSGIQNGYVEDLFVENVDGVISDGAISIFTNRDINGLVQSQPTRNLTLDNVTSQHNHTGIALVANGAGGISGVTIRNFNVLESRDVTRKSSPSTYFGIRLNDYNCLWSNDGDGIINDPCYITNVTFDTGSVFGCPGHGLSFQAASNGPNRGLTVRGTHFEGNGYGIGGTDSRDVDLVKWPGTVFEGNTVMGVDYNRDGRPDLSHLIRADSDGLILRNNYIYGIVDFPNRLVHISESKNVKVFNNNFECKSIDDCIGISIWINASNADVQGNYISLKQGSGTGVGIMTSTGHRIVGNFIKGGKQKISATSNQNIIQSNMLLD